VREKKTEKRVQGPLPLGRQKRNRVTRRGTAEREVSRRRTELTVLTRCPTSGYMAAGGTAAAVLVLVDEGTKHPSAKGVRIRRVRQERIPTPQERIRGAEKKENCPFPAGGIGWQERTRRGGLATPGNLKNVLGGACPGKKPKGRKNAQTACLWHSGGIGTRGGAYGKRRKSRRFTHACYLGWGWKRRQRGRKRSVLSPSKVDKSASLTHARPSKGRDIHPPATATRRLRDLSCQKDKKRTGPAIRTRGSSEKDPSFWSDGVRKEDHRADVKS